MKGSRVLLITLLLIAVVTLAVTETGTFSATEGKRKAPTAKQIFAFVEHVDKDPKIDRTKAEVFLQNLLDGKIRFVSKPPTEATGNRTCYQYECDNLSCVECDEDQETCWCSTCCIAASKK
jgi:hypothetical protein